jgi:hypothetical protein
MMHLLLILNLVATSAMATIVTFVHIVQYPLLMYVPPESVPTFERAYAQRAGYVIAPLMLLEVMCGVLLCMMYSYMEVLTLLNLVLLALIWFITFAVSVPKHNALGGAWDPKVHTELLDSNRGRLVAWLLRLMLAVALLARPLNQ